MKPVQLDLRFAPTRCREYFSLRNSCWHRHYRYSNLKALLQTQFGSIFHLKNINQAKMETRSHNAVLLSFWTCYVVFYSYVFCLFRTMGRQPSSKSYLRSYGLGYALSPKHSHLLPCLQHCAYSSWNSTSVSNDANLSFLFNSRKANLASSRFFTASIYVISFSSTISRPSLYITFW